MRTPAPLTRRLGLIELALSALLFGLMAYLTKHATRRLSGAQAAFVRFAVGLLAIGLRGVIVGARLQPRRFDLLFLRGLFGGIAVLGYFVAIQQIPVGTATLLHYTAPVFTTLFAALFLRERPPAAGGFALAAAALGVSLVVWGQGQVLGGAYGWQFLALGSAVISGAAVTSIRAARRYDGPWEVFTAFCLIGLVCTAPLALLDWRSPAPREWLLLVAVGLVAVVAQVLMTHALGAVEAATGGIIGQVTVITAMLLGHWVDGEPLTAVSGAGAILTLGGVSLAARVSSRTPDTAKT